MIKPTYALMLKLHFYTQCHSSDMFQSTLSIFRELLCQSSVYKNIDGLLNTLKFVHKMYVDFIKSIFSSGTLAHKMLSLFFYSILQLFISGGCQVCVLVAKTRHPPDRNCCKNQ